MKSIPLFPEQASNFAQEVDLLYFVLLALTVVFSLGVFIAILIFVAKYRAGSKADRSNPPYHNMKLELTWSVIPAIMSFGVFYWAADLFVDMQKPIDPKSALNIYVIGKQWMWHLQHPTGQRENNELHIPKGRAIQLTMISQDVLHSFFVPEFRIKKDVLPGRYTTQWFIPTKTGKFHLLCTEFCGAEHSKMGGSVYVMEPEDYEEWLRQTRWGLPSATQPAQQPETMAQSGERLFAEKQCVSCHASDSRLNVPLAGVFGTQRRLDDGRTVVADEEYIRRSILEPDSQRVAGFNPVMPSFKGRLDEQQILQLIAYIRAMRTNPTRGEETASALSPK
jgi:cytochrome c oxidase subunit 2